MVEFYEDLFDEKPLEAMRDEQGNIRFTDTGDALIDQWESDIANGMTPDLWSAFSPEMQEKLKKRRKPGGFGAEDLLDPRKQRKHELSKAPTSASIPDAIAEGKASYMRAFETFRK